MSKLKTANIITKQNKAGVSIVPNWSIKYAFKLLFILFILPILILVLLLILTKVSHEFKTAFYAQITITKLYVGFSIFYLFAVCYIAATLKKRHKVLQDLGLRKFSIRVAIKYWLLYPFYYLTLALVLVAVIVGISQLIGLPLSAQQVQPNQDIKSVNWAVFLLGVFCAPIIEELLFRGILLPALAKKYGWRRGSVFSSLMFSALHGPAAPFVLIFSLYQCRLYYRTGSIIPGILLHMANNAIVLSLIFLK